MLYNLKIEMLKKGIEINDIAKAIGQHRNTAADKISGKRSFSIPEAKAIKETFFPDQTIEYLFSTTDEKEAGGGNVRLQLSIKEHGFGKRKRELHNF